MDGLCDKGVYFRYIQLYIAFISIVYINTGSSIDGGDNEDDNNNDGGSCDGSSVSGGNDSEIRKYFCFD